MISVVPQGTVLCPILFLLLITFNAREVSPQSTDCDALQQDLQAVYKWADDVNVIFNGDKFEALRFWPGSVPKPPNSYLDPDGNPILKKKSLRDLGVQISSILAFSNHIEEVVAAPLNW